MIFKHNNKKEKNMGLFKQAERFGRQVGRSTGLRGNRFIGMRTDDWKKALGDNESGKFLGVKGGATLVSLVVGAICPPYGVAAFAVGLSADATVNYNADKKHIKNAEQRLEEWKQHVLADIKKDRDTLTQVAADLLGKDPENIEELKSDIEARKSAIETVTKKLDDYYATMQQMLTAVADNDQAKLTELKDQLPEEIFKQACDALLIPLAQDAGSREVEEYLQALVNEESSTASMGMSR